MPTPSRSRQSILLDAIFHERDQHLHEAFRQRMAKLELREQLTQVSGIRDESVLDRVTNERLRQIEQDLRMQRRRLNVMSKAYA